MKYCKIIHTGQIHCYDSSGHRTSCLGSGQDGEYLSGSPWPEPRFIAHDETVLDQLTDLVWTTNANLNEYPLTWLEALEKIKHLNQKKFLGFNDWRLPNRRELRSVMSYQARKPSLPTGHPFINVFPGWYWTSTTAAINPAYAWYVHLEGARMFYGKKDQYYLFWPVRGKANNLILRTGQTGCYDNSGKEMQCLNSGQDGELRQGCSWPEQRFQRDKNIVHDRLTGLKWSQHADITDKPVNWQQALDAVRQLNDEYREGINIWRLPNINELESLVDCSAHSPALPHNHPFAGVKEGYWSSTTSYFETDWAWVLYMIKGACGVGYKSGTTFHVWPVY